MQTTPSTWERSGQLALALWFILPGSLAAFGGTLKYVTEDFEQTLLPLVGIVMGLTLVVAGSLAAAGRLFLALLLLILDLATSTAALGGFMAAPASAMGGRGQFLASVFISAAGVAWILGGRYSRSHSFHRALAMSVVVAFALNVPIIGSRFGEGLGTLLAPAPVSRIAEPGERLPGLRFLDLSGSIASLSEPGTIYVVNFWATWCGPCRLELPHLLDMIEALPEGSPVRLLAVNTEGLGREAVEEFIEKEGLTGLEVYTDPAGAGDLLGTGTIPLTVVIRDRTLLTRQVGYGADTIKRLRDELVRYLEDGRPGTSVAPTS